MQNNSLVKYGLRLIIVLLAFGVYFVLEKKAEIKNNEEMARELSRERMTILKEALNHYAQINKRYTTNFDTLLMSVRTDTLLNRRRKLVELTTDLLDEVDLVKSNPVFNNVFEIKKASKELVAILEEVSDAYKQFSNVMELTTSTKEDIQSFEMSNDYFDFASMMNVADSVNYLSIEINEFTLQGAVDQAKNYITIFKSHAPNANVAGVTSYWNDVYSQLKQLESILNGPDMEVQVFTNRYLKHIEIIQKNLASLAELEYNSEIGKFDEYLTSVSKLGDTFVNDYFALSASSALKGLEKDQQVLVQIDENTIFAPPLMKDQYKIEITNNGLGYLISCPNPKETSEFSVGIFSQRYKNYGSINTGEKDWEIN